MQIKIVALFLFTTGKMKGYNSQVFGLCSSITGKNYTTCFLNFTPKQKQVKASITSIPSDIDVLGQVSDARFIQLTKYVSVCAAPLLYTNYEMKNRTKLFFKRELYICESSQKRAFRTH